MSNTIIKGVVAIFDRDNIDTDQIIPTEYLKSIKKFGFGDYLFDGWRYFDEGRLGMTADERQKKPDFILNQDPFTSAQILLARDNFGCGSSREHAVWALRDFGFKAVIASSFGDIFYNNCFKNSVLPIHLSKQEINALFKLAKFEPVTFEINLIAKELRANSEIVISFEADDNLLDRIIFNIDDIDITLKDKNLIKDFENHRRETRPWIFADYD